MSGNNTRRVEIIKTIFNDKDINKLIIISRPKLFNFFSINSIFNFRKITSNLIIKKKILKKLNHKKIDIDNYDEILITNDLISKLFIRSYKYNIKYFFHGWGDIIHLKKSNNFINQIKAFITLKIFSYYLVTKHKHIIFYNVFKSIYNKKFFHQPNLINKKIYKKNLFDLVKKIKVKKKIINPLILNEFFVVKYINQKNAETVMNFYIKKLGKYIDDYKIKNVILKPKLNYNKKHLKLFIKIFEKNYPNVKVYSIFKIIEDYIPLETVLILIQPCFFFSTRTTADYVIKRLALTKHIKIINAYNFIESWRYHSLKSELDLAREKNTNLIINSINA